MTKDISLPVSLNIAVSGEDIADTMRNLSCVEAVNLIMSIDSKIGDLGFSELLLTNLVKSLLADMPAAQIRNTVDAAISTKHTGEP